MTLNLKPIVVLIISLLSSATLMSAQTIIETGKCGKKLTWTLDDNDMLTISGTGKMYDFYGSPWENYHLDKVVINKGVTSIGDRAFYDCSGLTSVEIPTSVTSIGVDAFAMCNGLTSVEIPTSVTSIGDGAFNYCSRLTSVKMPNSVTSIGYNAFNSCERLTSVKIPNSVTSIGEYAFAGCSGLNKIQVATDNKVYDSRDSCNAIIKTATNTLITGCKTTKIPNSVTSIGNWAFSSCKGLTSIEIPNSVTSIGESAFAGCIGLTSVEIPNSVTNIRFDAFSACIKLTKIKVLAKTPPVCHISAFDGVDKRKCEIEVPQGSLGAYKSAGIWKNFKNITQKSGATKGSAVKSTTKSGSSAKAKTSAKTPAKKSSATRRK